MSVISDESGLQSNEGLKDILEVLVETIPVKKPKKSKSPKLSKHKKQEAVMKPITHNQKSREILAIFIDLLLHNAEKYESPSAAEFANSLRSSLN